MLADPHKAVELLRLLDAGAVELLLAELKPQQAQQLRQQLLTRQEGSLSLRQRVGLLGEFERGVQLLSSAVGPRLHVPTESESDPTTPTFTPSGEPLEDLARIGLHQLARALEAESSRAAALLLAQLPPERSAEVLSVLPEAQRDAVVRAMSQPMTVPPAVLQAMAQAALTRAADLPAEPRERIDRVDRLAKVLRAVPKAQRRAMLEAIRVQDHQTADAIQSRLYQFEDVVQLPDRAVQQLLVEVNTTQLALALSGAPQPVADKLLGNLSKRARSALQEELQFRSNPALREVQQARDEIAKVIARLDQEE